MSELGDRSAALFVYGTLRDPDVLAAVMGSRSGWRFGSPGTIAGTLHDAGAYPALRPARRPGCRVRGVLLELDDGAGLARLDAYEGVGEGLYVRRRCRVRLEGGAVRDAWTYVYTRPADGLPRIEEWRPVARDSSHEGQTGVQRNEGRRERWSRRRSS